MRLRDQLIGAVVLAGATYFSLLRIAEAKCDEAVGAQGHVLDASRGADLAAFGALRQQLVLMGQQNLADRLETLRESGEIFVAPSLGPHRWAVYVESLRLVRRIYVGGSALRDPAGHLFQNEAPSAPMDHVRAFAWLSLGGAMRHEVAHRDGAIEETAAYRIELDWYEEIRRSAFLKELAGESRTAWEWGLDSAVLSAKKAARSAGAAID